MVNDVKHLSICISICLLYLFFNKMSVSFAHLLIGLFTAEFGSSFLLAFNWICGLQIFFPIRSQSP